MIRQIASRKLLLLAVGFAVLIGLGELPRASAQSATADWEKAAGGKMSFEVASVKPGSREGGHSNIPLTLGSSFAPVGNLMSVNVPLRTLIGFAFKLSVGQTHFFMPGLPDWVDSESFDIEGRAPIANPSKDQFRLMVQSLLANRFKLVIQKEQRPLRIYALVLAKPGRTGSQLRPHVGDAECGAAAHPNDSSARTEFSPYPCGFIQIAPARAFDPSAAAGRLRGGGRDVDLNYIAAFLSGAGYTGTTPDRPVVNETGLTGSYDFWVEFVPDASTVANGTPTDTSGPSFPEALRDQLGLKLVAKTEPVDLLVINHIEQPTPN